MSLFAKDSKAGAANAEPEDSAGNAASAIGAANAEPEASAAGAIGAANAEPEGNAASAVAAASPSSAPTALDARIEQLGQALDAADSIMIGAGAGLSTSAGFTYSGERFDHYFSDFHERYGFTDMYSGGFYPYKTPEEMWAFWSRYIKVNRYTPAPKDTYEKLLRLVDGRDYFVLTTNVDHQFQLAGFDKKRLFYTQGDYGLMQCPTPCHNKTYDNEELVEQMVAQQHDLRVPSELVPHCPVCGKMMVPNLRSDDSFVEDDGWHEAAARYAHFVRTREDQKTLYLELGVGYNTPVIIKYPFWKATYANPKATYATINLGNAETHPGIRERSICIDADIDVVLGRLLARKGE